MATKKKPRENQNRKSISRKRPFLEFEYNYNIHASTADLIISNVFRAITITNKTNSFLLHTSGQS